MSINTRYLGKIEGFDVRAELVPDDEYEDEASPYGIIVTASKAYIDLGTNSLWMTDETVMDGDGEDFAHGYGPQLIEEAIAAAKAKLAELTEA